MEEIEQAEPAAEPGMDAAEGTATEAVAEIEQQPETPEAKTFSQEELDRIVEKRLAKERRKLERERQEPKQVQQQPLDPTKFASTEEFVEALAEQKAAQKVAERERMSQHRQIVDAYQEREEEARDKYPDFERVAYNPAVPISDVMAVSIQASDLGPDIAYHLGQNVKEAARIAKLPPLLQAKEIGKLEAKLTVEKERPKVSTVPEPIKPVGVKGNASKRVEDMTDDEFAEHRRKIRAQRK